MTAVFVASILLLVVVAASYAQLIGPVVFEHMNERSDSKLGLVGFIAVVGAPLLILLVVLGFVWGGIVSYVADGSMSDRPVSLTRAAGASLRRAPVAFAAMLALVLGLIVTLLLAPLISLVGLCALVATPVVRRTGLADRWPPVRVLVLMAVPFAVAVFLVIRLSLTLSAIWLDGLSLREAATTSWQRVDGSMRLVGLVLALASVVATGVVVLAALVDARIEFGSSGIAVGQLAAQLLVAPLPLVAATVLYRSVSSGGAPLPGAPQVAPLPGSGRRQVAATLSVALGLQLIVWLPTPGLSFTDRPVEAAEGFRVLLFTSPPSPFESGVPIDVAADVWDPSCSCETGGPTGEVVLLVDGTEIARSTLDGNLWTSYFPSSHTFTAGTHQVIARYLPAVDETRYPQTDERVDVVAGSPSTTTLTVDPVDPPRWYGNPVTLRADVSGAGGTPTGSVRFEGLPGGPIDAALDSGRAEVVVNDIPPGPHTVTAYYNDPPSGAGGSHLPSTSSSVAVAVYEAPTEISVNTAPTSPSSAEANVTATVTVRATTSVAIPTGSITVKDLAGSTLATGALVGGSVDLDLALPPGRHDLRAQYAPGTGFAASPDRSFSHTVSPFTSTVTILASTDSSVSGQPVALTAQVAGRAGFTATGIVDFVRSSGGVPGPTVASAPLVNGSVTVDITATPVGSHEFVARYAGDTSFSSGDSAPLSHTVSLASAAVGISVVQSTPVVGDTLSVVVDVAAAAPSSANPGGSVELYEDGILIDTQPVAASIPARFEFVPNGAGVHRLTATYSGNSELARGSTELNVTIGRRPVTLTVFAPPDTNYSYGEPIRLDGVVFSSGSTATPTGTVALSANGVALGDVSLDTSGRFSFTTDLVQVGANIELVASYPGDANFAEADTRTSPRRVAVRKASASPTVSVNGLPRTVGDRVQVTVDLRDLGSGPTGSVEFSTSFGVIGTAPVANGSATIDLLLTDTTTWVSATYSGDASFLSEGVGPSRVDAARAPSSMRITDPGALHYGDVVTLRIPVDTPPGVPNRGVVQLRDGTSIILRRDVPVTDGEATIDICAGDSLICPPEMPTLALGTHRLEANFSGTNVLEPSEATLDVDVVIARSNVSLTTNNSKPCIGCRVVLTATVGSATSDAPATGAVYFETLATQTSTSRSLGSVLLVNGVATLQFDAGENLAYPIDTVVARYLGAFRSFGPGVGVTSLVLDRRDVSVSGNPVSGTVDNAVPVSVSIGATEPGRPIPFTEPVTLVADNGDSCTARFPVAGPSVASCLLRWDTVGQHQVIATYPGDEFHEPATSSAIRVTVEKRPSSSQRVTAPARVLADTTFDVTWNFEPTATGTITVLDQPGCVDIAVSARGCTAQLGRREIGRTDTLLRVRYSGDGRFLRHQFELPVVVGGCHDLEVYSANPSGGSVTVETPPNCVTDAGVGYLDGTRVVVSATATGQSEFVRWRSGNTIENTERATFTVTDDFESWLLFADFQLACFPVAIAPVRGEPDVRNASAYGTVTLQRSDNADNGRFDGRCQVVGGGDGFEVGTTVSFDALPQFNPTYGEPDLVYGFENTPATAVVQSATGRAASLTMVVDGPIAARVIFGPRCRAVNTRVEPEDDGATVRVERAPDCRSPFGDGYRRATRTPTVSVIAAITDTDLHLAGWTIDGTDDPGLGTRERITVPLGAGDLDVVARFRRCHTLTVRGDQLPNPDVIDDGLAAVASPTTPPDCPDGSDRYLTGTEVTVVATLRNPQVEVAWSDNVTPDPADGLSVTIVVTDDVEISPNFFLRSVCSQLSIDDPLGLLHVDEALMDSWGLSGCGAGYYLDSGKVAAQSTRDEVAGVERSSYGSDGEYERRLQRTQTRFYSSLPIRLATKTELAARGIELAPFADVETWGGPAYTPECFPMTCSGPVTGNLHITASVCQTIRVTGTVTVRDDPSETVYGFSDIRPTTMAFGGDGTGTQQPLRPWLESTDLSDPVPRYDSRGSLTGYVHSACESFENAHPPGAALSVRAGVTVPGLYLDGWTDEVNIPVTTEFGFEYQTFLLAEESPAEQTVNAEFVAVCRTLAVGAGITVVDSPPNCPGSNSYIVGSFVKVRAEKFLGPDTYLRSSRWTKKLYEFSEGLITGSETYVAPGPEEQYFEPYYEGYVYIDNDKSVAAKYRSENDGLEYAVVTSAKLIAGVTALALPVLLTSVICGPCGMVLGGLATAAFLVDLIPGTDGKATAALDLINPMSFFQCVGKWGANTPTPPRDPVADGGTVVSAVDELSGGRLEELSDVIDGVIALAEEPIEDLPVELAAATEALVLDTIESMVGSPEDLPVLRSILFDGGDEADFSVLQPASWDLDGLAQLKEDGLFLKKAAKTLKRIKYYRSLGTAFTKGYATEGLIGITGRLKGGWRALKEQRTLFKQSRNPATRAAWKKAGAAMEFVGELADAGYLSIDGLSRNNGYQSVADLAGTSTFTDCLDDKYRAQDW